MGPEQCAAMRELVPWPAEESRADRGDPQGSPQRYIYTVVEFGNTGAPVSVVPDTDDT
jgi:hypothetical protein